LQHLLTRAKWEDCQVASAAYSLILQQKQRNCIQLLAKVQRRTLDARLLAQQPQREAKMDRSHETRDRLPSHEQHATRSCNMAERREFCTLPNTLPMISTLAKAFMLTWHYRKFIFTTNPRPPHPPPPSNSHASQTAQIAHPPVHHRSPTPLHYPLA
jgi:hypothetical protein